MRFITLPSPLIGFHQPWMRTINPPATHDSLVAMMLRLWNQGADCSDLQRSLSAKTKIFMGHRKLA
jgi:hypothetical protein